LLTPRGPKAIETFQVGDEILTRLEWEPDAPVLVSQVEARFENVARIWHLHLASGQVIRTTAEHPFYVDGRGWVPAGELRPGDLLVSHDGQRVVVAELYDTGTYERVYNLAIRSFHTYFVCDETWPCSVWAHNSCGPGRPLDQAQKLRSHEIETGRRLEQRLGRKIYESVHEGADFVDEIGKTYDAVGGGKRAARHFKWSEYKRTIDRDLRKSVDYVVIDLTGFSESQI
jgi:intein/homing endonuclease